MSRNQRGFTLLEVLVAAAIFALVAVAAFALQTQAIVARDAIVTRTDRLSQLQRGFDGLQRELLQAVMRSGRDSFGDRQPAFKAENGSGQLGSYFEFTQDGWRNPTGRPRSSLRHRLYRYNEGRIERLSWSSLDQAAREQPQVTVLMDKVKSLNLRFFADKQWQDRSWPAQARTGSNDTVALPQLLEMTIDFDDIGKIRRVFAIGGN